MIRSSSDYNSISLSALAKSSLIAHLEHIRNILTKFQLSRILGDKVLKIERPVMCE